jgi:hypothetical protein
MNREHDEAYLRELARRNVCEGILHEPRLYYDAVRFEVGDARQFTRDDVFRNGEQYPVRITHILAAMRVGDDDAPAPDQGDERLIQRYGLRIRAHDTFYQTQTFVPFPLFHNCLSAAAEAITRGTSNWKFPKTFPLGQRDTLVVDVQLEFVPDNSRVVGVSFHGRGRASHRPYHLSARATLDDTSTVRLATDDYRNDGTEVIDIYEVVIHCGSDTQASNPSGDIQQLLIGIRQTGNGTQQQWDVGPVSPFPTAPSFAPAGTVQLSPAVLWGVNTGRAIVHELPEPWLWQPGQGVTPELESFDTTRTTIEDIWLAMAGHVVVT